LQPRKIIACGSCRGAEAEEEEEEGSLLQLLLLQLEKEAKSQRAGF